MNMQIESQQVIGICRW